MSLKALILSDGSHRVAQAEYILHAMAVAYEIREPPYGNITDWPDFTISIGTLATDEVLAVLKTAPHVTAKIHLLDPGKEHERFDLIVLPDYEPRRDGNNLFITQGIVNKIQIDMLPRGPFIHLPSSRITVLLGGKHVYGDITPAMAADLATQLNAQAGCVLVTTSPRTGAETSHAFGDALTVPHIFYDWKQDRDQPNPYGAMLGDADAIIVSGDSIRMVSEACSSGKPVYIWLPEGSHGAYHAFHDGLIASGVAQYLTPSTDCREHAWYRRENNLDEAKRVANAIVAILMRKRMKRS